MGLKVVSIRCGECGRPHSFNKDRLEPVRHGKVRCAQCAALLVLEGDSKAARERPATPAAPKVIRTHPGSMLEITQFPNAIMATVMGTHLRDQTEKERFLSEFVDMDCDFPAKGIVLNLENVRAIGSSVIELLLALQKQLQQERRKLSLCKIRPEVAPMFKLVDAAGKLDIHRSVRGAMSAVGEKNAADPSKTELRRKSRGLGGWGKRQGPVDGTSPPAK